MFRGQQEFKFTTVDRFDKKPRFFFACSFPKKVFVHHFRIGTSRNNKSVNKKGGGGGMSDYKIKIKIGLMNLYGHQIVATKENVENICFINQVCRWRNRQLHRQNRRHFRKNKTSIFILKWLIFFFLPILFFFWHFITQMSITMLLKTSIDQLFWILKKMISNKKNIEKWRDKNPNL